MDWNMFMNSVFEHITVPIIILVGGVILAVLKPYAKKITASLTMKNEMESLEKMTQAKSNFIEQLDKLVESAVAANMQLAETMKANGHKLTDEQIQELNQSAKDLVMSSLPIDTLDPEGDLYKLIGGEEKLDKMITSLMEKHVYAYKLLRAQTENKQRVVSNDYQGTDDIQEFVPEDEVPVEDSEPISEPEPQIVNKKPIKSTLNPPARFGLG